MASAHNEKLRHLTSLSQRFSNECICLSLALPQEVPLAKREYILPVGLFFNEITRHFCGHLAYFADIFLSLCVLCSVIDEVFCFVAINLDKVVLDIGVFANSPSLFKLVNLALKSSDCRFFVNCLADQLVNTELLVELASHHLS